MMRHLWVTVLVFSASLIFVSTVTSESVSVEEDDIEALIGSSVNIVCIVTSSNTLVRVSWTFDRYHSAATEKTILQSSKYIIVWSQTDNYKFRSTLKITNVAYEDEGRYTCSYNNSWATTDVIVQGRPNITNSESKINGVLGTEVTLTCSAQVKNSPVNSTPTVAWLGSGRNTLRDSFKHTITPTYNSIIPVFKTQLTIHNLNSRDLHAYSCEISNKYGSAKWTFIVTANADLQIIEPTSPVREVTLYDTQSFKCRLTNIQDINAVKWYFGYEDRRLVSDEFAVREIRTYSESRGGAVSELFFVRLSLQNEGRYYCTWKTLSDSRYLRVVGSLGINAVRTEIDTVPGSQISLECSVESRPISEIHWYFGTDNLLNGSQYTIETAKASDILVRSTLTIREVTADLFDNSFVCEGNNSRGETSSDEIKLIGRSTPAPTTTAVTTTPTTVTSSVSRVAVAVGIGLGLFGIVVLIAVIVCCLRKRSGLKELVNFKRSTSARIYNTTFDVLSDEAHIYSELKPNSEEFPRDRLRFKNLLGEGKFGKVYKAQALDIRGFKKWDDVAVKMVKESSTDADKEDFYQELLIVRKIPHHINVVAFLGCCTDGDPTLMIMEYVPGGDLLTHLRKCRPGSETTSECFNQKDLLSFAFQSARGLRHLENNSIVHRDVAARNVLIDEKKVCKISDFGLARDIEGADVYERTSKGPLPVRWMAPESLRDSIHTHKSDVWAYGVLLWEIVTLGSSPFPGMSGKQVMTYILEGRTQECPPQCKEEISKIMKECWEFSASNRPSFNEIVQILERLLEEEGDYLQLENMEDGIYMILDGSFTEERL